MIKRKDVKLQEIVTDYNNLNLQLEKKDKLLNDMMQIGPKLQSSLLIIEKLQMIIQEKDKQNEFYRSQIMHCNFPNQDNIMKLVDELKRLQSIIQHLDSQYQQQKQQNEAFARQNAEQARLIHDLERTKSHQSAEIKQLMFNIQGLHIDNNKLQQQILELSTRCKYDYRPRHKSVTKNAGVLGVLQQLNADNRANAQEPAVYEHLQTEAGNALHSHSKAAHSSNNNISQSAHSCGGSQMKKRYSTNDIFYHKQQDLSTGQENIQKMKLSACCGNSSGIKALKDKYISALHSNSNKGSLKKDQ